MSSDEVMSSDHYEKPFVILWTPVPSFSMIIVTLEVATSIFVIYLFCGNTFPDIYDASVHNEATYVWMWPYPKSFSASKL